MGQFFGYPSYRELPDLVRFFDFTKHHNLQHGRFVHVTLFPILPFFTFIAVSPVGEWERTCVPYMQALSFYIYISCRDNTHQFTERSFIDRFVNSARSSPTVSSDCKAALRHKFLQRSINHLDAGKDQPQLSPAHPIFKG